MKTKKNKIPQKEKWLFDLQNKKLVLELKKALKQKVHISINLDDLEKVINMPFILKIY